ncbi:unnamed protein product [Pelagomonas calceolata]|uniref:Transmembrane protein n=1 Tax=Pelagomonas calceolata TaxID=35677 RepID=A0A7S3ZSJ0_9STRA|nr:unnamed protein product [Pelagomonas calceolata]
MAQRFVGQPGGKTAFDKRHSDDSLAPAAQLQRRETSKRLVSWEGSNQLALLDSDYKAAHCRRYTGRATVREPTFSLREFCKAYAYETLPPVLDLAAASLLEGSLAKGWHVTGYRALRPSPAHIGWGNSIFAGVFGHITWAPLVYAVNYAYFTSRVVRAHVDPVELLVLDVFQLIRNGVVATKYAYFEEEDLESMRQRPPAWSWDKTDRQLLLGGGLSPKDYAGLLEALVVDAMATADIDLRAVDVAIDEDGAAAVRDLVKATGGDAFAAPDGRTSAAAVLWCLLARHWSVGLAPKAVLFVVAEVLMILFLPAIERTALGGAPYGPPGLVRFVLVMYTVLLAFGPKTATPTLIFPMAAANDWHRRGMVLGCLGDVFDAPGLSAGDLVRPTENTEGKVAPAAGTRIFLDPHDPKNVFAHAMMRPVLRRIARKIQLRCQAYLWIYFAGAIAALVVLNVLLWYPLSHRLLAAHLAALFAVLTGLSVVIIFVAAKTTNDITPIHRSRLQRERLAIEREISAGVDSTRAVTLEHARRLLKTLDENIAFEEVEREPASVLGVAASAGTIGSVLSLLLGGLLFAFEGYNSSRQNGWKYGEDGVFSKE